MATNRQQLAALADTYEDKAPRQRSVADVAYHNGVAHGIRTALNALKSDQPVPEGMTAEKLRYIADYIQSADSIIVKMIEEFSVRIIDTETGDKSERWRELATGHAVQDDLRKWADEIGG